MTTGYYLQDHPNPTTGQFGWLRTPLGRPGPKVSGVVGVHTSEAITDFEGVDNNAENNAAFIGRRTDTGSYHTTADADSILPLVHPAWSAWADTTNNAHAMSVSGCLQAARWLEMTPERRAQVVKNMAYAAAAMVRTAVADGYLAAPTPAVRISAAEAMSGSRPGFYGHGETNPGRRYDPGVHFDWALFLSTYASAVGGGINYASTTPQEDLMATPEQRAELIRDLLAHQVNQSGGGKMTLGELLAEYRPHVTQIVATTAAVPAAVLNAEVPRGGAMGGATSLGAMVAWNDDHVLQTIAAVAATAATGGATVDQIRDAVRASLEEGVRVDVTVNAPRAEVAP